MKLKVAHITVGKFADRVTEIYDHAPHEVVLESLIGMMGIQAKAALEIRQGLLEESETHAVAPALEAWDDTANAFLLRLDEYNAAFEGADTPEDLRNYVLDPILDGEYPEDMEVKDAPAWRDLETPSRLLNDLSQIMSIARPKSKPAQQDLAEDFKKVLMDSFAHLDASMTEPLMGAVDEEEQSTLDWAKQKAQEAYEAVDEYVQLKKIHEAAKRHAPIIFGALGAAAIILLANRR